MAEVNLVQSLVRGLDILQMIAGSESDGLKLTDISERSGLKRPTAHNLIATLVAKGFVENVGGGRYRAGPAIMQLAQMRSESSMIGAAATAMRRLADCRPRPILNYTELVGSEIIVRLRMSPDRFGILQRPTNSVANPYGNAGGLAWQAFGGLEVRLRLRERYPFCEHGINLWESEERLEDFLNKVRHLGYVIAPFNRNTLYLTSVPVFDADGELRAVLGAALRSSEVDDDSVVLGMVEELRLEAGNIFASQTACGVSQGAAMEAK